MGSKNRQENAAFSCVRGLSLSVSFEVVIWSVCISLGISWLVDVMTNSYFSVFINYWGWVLSLFSNVFFFNEREIFLSSRCLILN